MTIAIRSARPEDAPEAGRICHDAFEAISRRHNFPKDLPSVDVAVHVIQMLISHPCVLAVVAERDGTVVGSNFLDERAPIGAVGPISVDPSVQDASIGRRLMEAVLDRAAERRLPGVRLLQDAFHNRSLALYTKLGFRARGTTAVMNGHAVGRQIDGYEVRAATADDLDACDRLCTFVHGHARSGELADAIEHRSALVVERAGSITGYTTTVGFFGHSIGKTSEDLMALIAAVESFGGLGFHVPTENDELLRWCFDRGLRMVKAMTIMSIGLYNEPRGAYLPSVGY
jgi:predicted N-acetyltransferase YhbS